MSAKTITRYSQKFILGKTISQYTSMNDKRSKYNELMPRSMMYFPYPPIKDDEIKELKLLRITMGQYRYLRALLFEKEH